MTKVGVGVNDPLTMWPFAAKHAPMAEPELSPAMRRRLDELEEANRKLVQRVDLQERGLKALELDWQEWFDKFRLMYARLSKRIKDAANAEPEPTESPKDAPGSTNGRRLGYGQPPLHERAATSRRNY